MAPARDTLDTLSAIWILASNDDNPEISYKGLRYRLHLEKDVDERQLVAKHGELFRLKVPEARLKKLKTKYLKGEGLPAWLQEKPEGKQRDDAINGLTIDDFFRSQFRAGLGAPRSPITLVEWGLQHIDRIRKAELEAHDAQIRRLSSVWIPLFSALIALIAVGSTMYVQRQVSADQRALKEYEVSFRPKVDGYTRLLQAISTSFERAKMGDRSSLNNALDEMDLAAIQLEPLLKPDVRDRVRDQVKQFAAFCLNIGQKNKQTAVSDEAIDQFRRYRDGFRTTLYAALFR